MSIRFLTATFLLAIIVIAPINQHFDHLPFLGSGSNETEAYFPSTMEYRTDVNLMGKKGKAPTDPSFLWAYFVFTYVFTALALYFMMKETQKIIRIRQDYLGSQSTITDRTIRLSGIPKELRTEEQISEILEKLEIGKVESVTLCRDWKELDDLMDQRATTLRRLEESWTVHLGSSNVQKQAECAPQTSDAEAGDTENGEENDNLLGGSNNHVTTYEKPRPTTRLWYGFMNFQSRKVDAIDYYEEHLRKLDEKIEAARKKEYKATPLAFVTMDSIASCQMAIQALLDPSPSQLLAKLSPAPSDVVWRNTYLPRSTRMARSWSITILIVLLTIFWLIPVGFLAGLLSLCNIQKVWSQLANLLKDHDIARSLVQSGLPTVVVSGLNVAVPYLYDYLANMQGLISQSDVELSVISKNFFFTFFNFFLVFTVFGTVASAWPAFLKDSLKDTTNIPYALARQIKGLSKFYINFIVLQGIGLFPFRLLEFGSVSLYPISRMGAKTPRDYAELVQPPIFSYGFYLPTALLILMLCIVYSILPAGYMVLLFGLVYFVFGYFTYKYQLLYAMDHPQHATGGAWPMICYRIMIGLGVFQIAMAGYISLQQAFGPAVLVLPLLPFTIWFSLYFSRTYEPLLKFIALRSVRRDEDSDTNIAGEDVGDSRPPEHIRRGSTTLDEDREKGQKFVNPSLYIPLQKMWIDGHPDSEAGQNLSSQDESTASSMSLGDTHVWRENGDSNV